MQTGIESGIEYRNKDNHLWSVLPLAGISQVGTTSGSVTTDFSKPLVKKTKCYGIPYEGTYTGNTTLRVINFTCSSLDGPITTNGPLLYLFSGMTIAHIKWKLRNAPPGTKVGFYTANWLTSNTDENKYYLFATDRGLSLFTTECGEFKAFGVIVVAVIVEGNFPVELEVTYRNPKILTIPPLQLFLPQTFAQWPQHNNHCNDVSNDCKLNSNRSHDAGLFSGKLYDNGLCNDVIMTQTLYNELDGSIITQPTPNYITETATRIAYLEANAVNLIFTDPIPLNQMQLASTLLETVKFSNFPMLTNGSLRSLRYTKLTVEGSPFSIPFVGNIMAIRSFTKPGVNIIPVVTITVERTFSFPVTLKQPVTYVVEPETFSYGRLNVFTTFTPYSIRNQPCSFVIPGYRITTVENSREYSETQQWTFTTSLEANVESIGMASAGFEIIRLGGYLSTKLTTNVMIIKEMTIDFYSG